MAIRERELEMTPRGGAREGAGRPLKDPQGGRQTLNCRVGPKTLAKLLELRDIANKKRKPGDPKVSIGDLIDKAVKKL